jgi:hypothetical protein
MARPKDPPVSAGFRGLTPSDDETKFRDLLR